MWAFYWFYKFIVYKSLRYLTISILISILIIFFRPLVFLCFLGSIVVHFYVNYRSKYPILYNIIMLIILILLAYFVYNMLQDEIDNYLTINIEAGDEEKLQSTSTEIEIGTFKIINIFVGLFGPFPTYMQLGGKDIEIIQSPGIYLKSFLSIFFCFFCSFIVLKKHFKYLPLVAFCFFNIIVLIVSSFTFDIRFHYPYLPMFIFSAIVGIDLIERKHLWWLINTYFAVLIIVIFIWNRRL